MHNKEQKLKYIISLKQGSKVPKYQTAWGKLDNSKKKLDEWTNNWQFRTTPQSKSRIIGGWKFGSRNGHTETGEEYTKRRTKEAQEDAKKRTKHIKKAADTAHMIGNLVTGIGTTGLVLSNPATTLGAIASGVAGEKAFNAGLGKLADMTGSKVRSWKDLTNKYLGWSPTLQTFTNPGTIIGGGIGAKGAQLANKAANYAIRMDMPRFGYTPTTKYIFNPNQIGSNGVEFTPVEKIFNFERWNRFRNPKYVTEQDKRILSEHLPEYKLIQEKALDEGTYMQTPKNFPGSKINENGEYIFQGDEGSWIQSQSKDFKAKFGDKTLKIGYKGGTDQKIEGIANTHTPETFPIQDNGVFFAGPQDYANLYNNGKPAPGFWLGFKKPYDMINGNKKPFLLEDNNIRFVRSVEASPSFKGEFPDQTINTIHKVWNSEFINDPEIMKLLTSNPHTLNSQQAKMRLELLHKIRSGQHRNIRDNFIENIVKKNIQSGKYRPLAGNYYDGYIGRDHAFGYGEYNGVVKDDMWPFGSFPETYVIKQPEQASSIIGNNGAFKGPACTRKLGGKLYGTRFKRFR